MHDLTVLTMFSWGYWGWSKATRIFLEAADALEASRGYAPPIFVDIRFHRDVRSTGFKGDAFEETVTGERYRWMKSLGSVAVVTTSGRIRIAEPSDAEELLDFANRSSKKRQRIIFFCACATPMLDGDVNCHRYEVGTLLLKAARKKDLSLNIVEWPGRDPMELDVELSPKEFRSVVKSGARAFSVDTSDKEHLTSVAGLPWCSIVILLLDSNTEEPEVSVISGPGAYSRKGWKLPIIYFDPYLTKKELNQKAQEIRECSGFHVRSV
jgi:hypothetical protein